MGEMRYPSPATPAVPTMLINNGSNPINCGVLAPKYEIPAIAAALVIGIVVANSQRRFLPRIARYSAHDNACFSPLSSAVLAALVDFDRVEYAVVLALVRALACDVTRVGFGKLRVYIRVDIGSDG